MSRIVLALLLAACAAQAEVARPSPGFLWTDAAGKPQKAEALRGRPVVVVIADSPRQWAFRSQVGQIQKLYEQFAASGLVCVAAFSQEQGLLRSNIPFLGVPDPAAVCTAFDAPAGFAVALIGSDGNLDFIGNRVLPAQRMLDIIQNSYAVQKKLRRD
jgi:hypothetical protein